MGAMTAISSSPSSPGTLEDPGELSPRPDGAEQGKRSPGLQITTGRGVDYRLDVTPASGRRGRPVIVSS